MTRDLSYARLAFLPTKKIGIDEEVAHQVSASLDPDYNASKKDVLIMQEAMLQLQVRTDSKFEGFKKHFDEMQAKSDARYYELKTEMTQGFADVRSEMHNMHRQYRITFGGLITTIISVFAVNWYFH